MAKNKEYNFKGTKGLVIEVKARATKSLIRLWHGLQSGLSQSGYITECVTHGTKVTHDNIKFAEQQIHHPKKWCEGCNEGKVVVDVEQKKEHPIIYKPALEPDQEFVFDVISKGTGLGATAIGKMYKEANPDKTIVDPFSWANVRLKKLITMNLIKKNKENLYILS